MKKYIIGLDEGTTSARVALYSTEKNEIVDILQAPISVTYPKPGWVEQNAEEIWQTMFGLIKKMFKKNKLLPEEIWGIGITNQREAIVAWDKTTGKPVGPSINWQCRRTAEIINKLTYNQRYKIKAKTGLIPDAYFSASKIMWLLSNNEYARKLLEQNNLLVGTIDTYLIWKLSGNFVTDTTNASRTMLFNISTMKWDSELCKLFGVPQSILANVLPCNSEFGKTKLFGSEIPICSVMGDQQSALFGQTCFKSGMVKNTYGTGCFILVNTGETPYDLDNMLSTVAYTIGKKTHYAIEGSVFNAGSLVEWLKRLDFFKKSAESEKMALSVESTDGLYLVPAFTGLGAPHWNMKATGTLIGITGNTNKNHITRAVLESMAYSTNDILEEMQKGGVDIKELRCDGGVSKNNFLMQFQSDISNVKIKLPACSESTIMGTIFMAGLSSGAYPSLSAIEKIWKQKSDFSPKMKNEERESLISGWKKAVKRSFDWFE